MGSGKRLLIVWKKSKLLNWWHRLVEGKEEEDMLLLMLLLCRIMVLVRLNISVLPIVNFGEHCFIKFLSDGLKGMMDINCK